MLGALGSVSVTHSCLVSVASSVDWPNKQPNLPLTIPRLYGTAVYLSPHVFSPGICTRGVRSTSHAIPPLFIRAELLLRRHYVTASCGEDGSEISAPSDGAPIRDVSPFPFFPNLIPLYSSCPLVFTKHGGKWKRNTKYITACPIRVLHRICKKRERANKGLSSLKVPYN
jgi:hypothetical protein